MSAGIAMNVAPLYFSKPKKKFSKSNWNFINKSRYMIVMSEVFTGIDHSPYKEERHNIRECLLCTWVVF